MSNTHSFTRPTILAAIELLAEKLSQASFDQMILRVELEQEIPQGKEVSVTNLSESIVIDMIKYVYEMQENDRRPQAWASRVAGDAATSNQGHP